MQLNAETIAAIATPPGDGGVGIIRISGSDSLKIAKALSTKIPKPRYATLTDFLDQDGSSIDTGILLYFPAPASFTGEDVLEIQAHGGHVVLDMLLKRVLSLGGRLAQPGEFTQRAFLNNKIDLTQAEAVADLISAGSEQAARSAQRSLKGQFSLRINDLIDRLIETRVFIEAAIDFVDEEIDFLGDGVIASRLESIHHDIQEVMASARQGRLLRDGMTVVLAGKPNAGKSSLLNRLAGDDVAIVTDIAGTTRDLLRESIQIDGMPLHVIDTAGLRESQNLVEQEGIRRARKEISQADVVVWLMDIQDSSELQLDESLSSNSHLIKVFNKIDLISKKPELRSSADGLEIFLSAKTGDGIEYLRQNLKTTVGYSDSAEQVFVARRRHLDALIKAEQFLCEAMNAMNVGSFELVAEELREAQRFLGLITGEYSADDLLGEIFSNFCIGK